MQKLYKRQQGLQTGGLTNIGYKLNQYPPIQGFGAKKSVRERIRTKHNN